MLFSQLNIYSTDDRRYEKLEKPLFEKRANLVSGTDKPADAKAAAGEGVPDFWLGAMRNCMVPFCFFCITLKPRVD